MQHQGKSPKEVKDILRSPTDPFWVRSESPPCTYSEVARTQASSVLDTELGPATLRTWLPLSTLPTSLSSQALPEDLERTQGTGGNLAETEPRHWATMTGYPQGAGLAAHTGNAGVETWHSWTRRPQRAQRGKVRTAGPSRQ